MFSVSLLTQSAMLALVLLVAINTSLYSVTALSLIYVLVTAASLTASGFHLAGVFLLLAELHVVYIVFCLALGWVRHDAVTAASIDASKTLLYAASPLAAFFCAAALGVSAPGSLESGACSYALTVSGLANYTAACKLSGASAVRLLAFSYANTLLFEFASINVLMFIAAYLYFKVRSVAESSAAERSSADAAEAARALRSLSTPVREQSQAEQLDADSAVRCVSVDGEVLDDPRPDTSSK